MVRKEKYILIFLILVALSVITFFFVKNHIDISSANNPDVEEASKVKPRPKKTIVYSYGGNNFAIEKIVSLFQAANPDIEVKLQQLPSSTDYQRNAYRIAFSSHDDSIDIINSDIIWNAEFASSKWVLSLEKYFDKSKREEFLTNAIEACLYNGEIYAIPRNTDVPLLFYRNDIISSPPQTYRELIQQAKMNINSNGIKYGYVFQAKTYEGLVCNALEFIWNNGGHITEDGTVVINSPNSIEGLQLFIDIINSDISSHDVLNFEEEDARMAFQDGSAIFMRNWPFELKRLNMDNSKVKGKVGIAPLPLGPEGTTSHGTLGGWNSMISSYSKTPESAWKFVEWLSSYDMQVIDNINEGYLPVRKNVYDNALLKKANPWMPNFRSNFEVAGLRPVSPNYASISESMQTNFANAIQGKITAKTAIENIEQDLKNTK